MKKILTAVIPFVLIVSCSKEDNVQTPPASHPEMTYTNLGDVAIKFGQVKTIDLNGDNTVDLIFSTMMVGDPLYRQDKKRFYANGMFDVFSLVNGEEQTPVLNANDSITVQDHPGHNWYNASSIILAEKIIGEVGDPFWQGNWKNASHKFYAVQVRKDNLLYNGWVEASFNTAAEQLVLHRAAVAKQPGKTVAAGR